MVHAGGICNNLGLKRKKMKTSAVNGEFGRNLKRFGNAETILKTSTLINECIMTLYETVVETAMRKTVTVLT